LCRLDDGMRLPWEKRRQQRLGLRALVRGDQDDALQGASRVVVTALDERTPGQRHQQIAPIAGGLERKKRLRPLDLSGVGTGHGHAAPQRHVVGVEADRLDQRVDGLARAAGALQRIGGIDPEAQHLGRREVPGSGARRRRPGIGGRGGKSAEPHQALGHAGLVLLLAAALQQAVQIEGGVGEEFLLDGDLRQLRQRMIAGRIDLERFLVERDRLGDEAGLTVDIADPHELRDRRRAVADLGIEVAQRVGGTNVAGLIFHEAQILFDREVELTLAHQTFCLLDGCSAIYAHARFIPSYQTGWRA